MLRIDSKFQNQDAIDLTKALNSESTFMSYGYDDDDQSDPSKPGTQEIKVSFANNRVEEELVFEILRKITLII